MDPRGEGGLAVIVLGFRRLAVAAAAALLHVIAAIRCRLCPDVCSSAALVFCPLQDPLVQSHRHLPEMVLQIDDKKTVDTNSS